jgi:hypothetical protein
MPAVFFLLSDEWQRSLSWTIRDGSVIETTAPAELHWFAERPWEKRRFTNAGEANSLSCRRASIAVHAHDDELSCAKLSSGRRAGRIPCSDEQW